MKNQTSSISLESTTTTTTTGGLDIGDRLLFAVPKKGRLHEASLKILQGADLQFKRKTRLDIAICTNLPVAIVFLPASDIARFVGEGNVDLGITGIDVVEESRQSDNCELIQRLGFGKCRLCVQVPEESGIKNARQLVGRRVVTSFEHLANDYFSQLSSETTPETTTKVSYISGSVEAACSLGLADGIVDLVESGETMRAAHLIDIATLLESEAILICKKKPQQQQQITQDSVNHREWLKQIIADRIRGVIAAGRHSLVKYNIERGQLKQATKITPGRRAPTISPLDNDGWVAVEAMIETREEGKILDALVQCGATDILVLEIKNCRV